MSGRIVVIGGGAAGMMAALSAAGPGVSVTLLERNPKVGRKLYITGKGRCNLTNDCSVEEVLRSTPRNGRFLTSAVTRFPPAAVKEYFTGLGVPLKTERGDRVFPVSDKASDVVDALFMALRKNRVAIVRDRAVELMTENGAVTGVKGEHSTYPCDAAILCTGGVSYPLTGSTGDGYAMAAALGHTIIPPKPSLIPLEIEGEECPAMQGLSLRNVVLKIKNSKGKTVYEEQGELLFTHFGMSGPIVLSASAHMRDFEGERYRAVIDLKPALDEQTLDQRLVRELTGAQANKAFHNVLETLVPRLMVPTLIARTGIPADLPANSVTKVQRRRLLETLKGLDFTVKGPRPVEEAIVTSGGIKVSEVDPKTMGSKLVQGLYLAGELLDVDGYTGGFNLQIAWSTGRAAGEAARAALLREPPQPPAGRCLDMEFKSIAIDGPSGAGKSTLAKGAAKALGFLYVDTGAIYRTLGLYALRRGADPAEPSEVEPLLAGFRFGLDHGEDGLQHMYLDGEDVTGAIRAPEVSQAASKISAIPAVRAFLLEAQRDLARTHNVIMDGRDIGTVVLPKAQVKIFLTASPEARARRRWKELADKGEQVDYKTVLADIIVRDDRDSGRAAAPLRQAEDAVAVDTTELDLEESLAAILSVIRGKL